MTDKNQTIATEASHEEWQRLLQIVRLSKSYHIKRTAWFDFLVKLLNALTIFAAMGVVYTVVESSKIISIVFGIAIALFSTICLVFNCSDMAKLHTDLKRKFADLEKNMVKCAHQTRQVFNEFEAEKISIDAEEPYGSITLDMICHNELVQSQGYGQFYNIGNE
ncbi:MAG: hypothetical protein LBU89_03770 [Fibromonadaceae bacterium]|jgi:hypothetical protein|nr:hypothetical protein [Fibromonadaceae bacterium]